MNEFLENPGPHALEVIHELVHARNGGETPKQHDLHEALAEIRQQCARFASEAK